MHRYDITPNTDDVTSNADTQTPHKGLLRLTSHRAEMHRLLEYDVISPKGTHHFSRRFVTQLNSKTKMHNQRARDLVHGHHMGGMHGSPSYTK